MSLDHLGVRQGSDPSRRRWKVLALAVLTLLLSLSGLPVRAQSYQYRRSITVDRTNVRNPALFPIAFDNVTSAKTTDAGELGKSWTHGVGSGNDKLAFVSVSSVPTAVTITADAGSSLGFTAQSSGTLGYTVGAGSNKALIVSVCIRNNTTVSSVTYGGTALSRIGAVDNTTWVRAEMWGVLNVTPQTANVVVTMSATADFVVGAVAFSNVGSIPTARFTSATGGASPASVVAASW